MKAEIKQFWVDALRSGEYKQGQLSLKTADNKYCCLGVLCDIYAKQNESKCKWMKSAFTDDYFFGSETNRSSAYLSENVMEWAELDKQFPAIENKSLTTLNDSGTTFKEIADLIKNNL